MNREQQTIQPAVTTQPGDKRKRKFWLVMPLVIFPFVTLLLWSIGLVGRSPQASAGLPPQGFNTRLPGAVPTKDSTWDKLKFYEQADQQASRLRMLLKDDPYSQWSMDKEKRPWDTMGLAAAGDRLGYDPSNGGAFPVRDANEEKVYRKLEALNAELNRQALPAAGGSNSEPFLGRPAPRGYDPTSLANREAFLPGDSAGDPEMDKIDGMLDKILDIQHPERIREKIRTQSRVHQDQVFPVYVHQPPVRVTRITDGPPVDKDTLQRPFVQRQEPAAIFSLAAAAILPEAPNAIQAVIDETKAITSGGTVRLRLQEEVYVQGHLVPPNTFVFGIGTLQDNRLLITVSAITLRHSILPVDLAVYDTDGMAGLAVNTGMASEVARQSSEQAMQQLSIASLDPSLGAQAASAGIQAAKSLIGKKTKLVRVTVKAGHTVFLKDNNARHWR